MYKWCIDNSNNCTQHWKVPELNNSQERLREASGDFSLENSDEDCGIYDWMIHWSQWQSNCVGGDLALSLPFSTPLPMSHTSLFMEHCSVYGSSALDWSLHGTFLNPYSLHLFCTKAPGMIGLGRNRYGLLHPTAHWWQITTNTQPACTTYIQMCIQSVRCHKTLCFLCLTEKPCSRETNCCVALALQWRMKVHRARQTSNPLQPPLSNKHIYYSSWAKLEVSLHAPPTSCYPGQWDSGCIMLGISTRMRKKKTNSPPTFSPH